MESSYKSGIIQTFPEDFSFDGTKTDIEQMIGNAVPVNLGYFVADAIFRYSGDERVYPRAKRRLNIQLNFLDMLDLYEGRNATMLGEEPAEYGHHRATIYPTEIHEKLFIARGDASDKEAFLADGVAELDQVPTMENVGDAVSAALDSLAEQGVLTIVMPAFKVADATPEANDGIIVQAISEWLERNEEKIHRVIVTVI